MSQHPFPDVVNRQMNACLEFETRHGQSLGLKIIFLGKVDGDIPETVVIDDPTNDIYFPEYQFLYSGLNSSNSSSASPVKYTILS